MRVGIIVLPTRAWPEQRERWRRAEAYGFDHGWTYDHLTWDPMASTPWGATIPTLVAAASVTERLPLGTWVASPNYRHPVPFAYDLAALDDVSGGRAVLGIGAGGTGNDARVLGQHDLTPAERAARLEEFVQILDDMLTSGERDHEISCSTEHYTVSAARPPLPGPQRPRLPFVVAANGPRLMRLALRYGRGWATTGVRDSGTDTAWWRGVAGLADRFGDLAAEAGREDVDRMLSVDAAPTFALASIEAYRDAVGRAAALGFTDVVVHWPEPGTPPYDAPESVLDEVAAEIAAARPPR